MKLEGLILTNQFLYNGMLLYSYNNHCTFGFQQLFCSNILGLDLYYVLIDF
jgi:hypothetical protein